MRRRHAAQPSNFPRHVEGFFGRNSTPTDGASQYPAKGELWKAFEQLCDQALRVVAGVTPEQLAGSRSIATLKPAFPRLGDLLVQMLTLHDGLHIGQLSDWRRASGRPRIIS